MTNEEFNLWKTATLLYKECNTIIVQLKPMLGAFSNKDASPEMIAKRKELEDAIAKEEKNMAVYKKVKEDIENKYFKTNEPAFTASIKDITDNKK